MQILEVKHFQGKNSTAVKYCSDCEEKLCGDCAGSHLRFKAFRSHHVIDLSSIGSKIPTSSKINCEIHTDIQIDYFCSQHDDVCCRACIPDLHSSCKNVLPLDVASKDVKHSSLLSDTLQELDHMTETLDKLVSNREDNGRDARSTANIIMLTTKIINLDVCMDLTVYLRRCWYF
jgi:hypothetical protein